MKKKICKLLVLLIIICNAEAYSTNKITILGGTKAEMVKADFWINKAKDENKIIMTKAQIKQFNNNAIKNCPRMADLENYKNSLTKNELKNLISQYSMKNLIVSNKDKNYINNNLDLHNIKKVNQLSYGIAIKDSDIRSFPTDVIAHSTNSSSFDRFQETGCQAFEPLLILYKSRDKKWLFVHTYNYSGWIREKDVAYFKSKKELFDYVNNPNFVVVTSRELKIDKYIFSLGTYVPLKTYDDKNYELNIVRRGMNGIAEFEKHNIAKSSKDVSFGYLKYTSANILYEAFKLQGVPYGWGDKGGRDCSSFIMYVYKTFGIRLPRNADEQEGLKCVSYNFKSFKIHKDRIAAFDKIMPGAAIYKNGHVMMYLGKVNGTPYMIHNFNSYMENGKIKIVNCVAVTSTLLKTSGGIEFINTFNAVKEFR